MGRQKHNFGESLNTLCILMLVWALFAARIDLACVFSNTYYVQ